MSDAFSEDPWATDTPDEDPWASGSDEAQATIPPTNTTAKTERPAVSEGKIVTTIKYAAGYDAPWTVIHAESVQESLEILNDTEGLKALIEKTARIAKFAKSQDSGSSPAPSRGGGQSRQNSTPPGQPAKKCSHGDMTYRTGNGAKGPWAGHFCPLDREDPDCCKPIFIKIK